MLIIEGSNKAVEKTIRDIKEAGADKTKTREIRKELDEKKTELKKEPVKSHNKKTKINKAKKDITKIEPIDDKPLQIGDFATIKDTDIIGELISLEGKDAFINVNDIKIKTSAQKLVKTKAPTRKTVRRKGSNDIINELNTKTINFKLSIDLRGKRAEEALSMLQKYIDEAMLLNMKEVSILHGKGFGILREVIREYLQSIDEIQKFGDAPIDMGGAGITRVYF